MVAGRTPRTPSANCNGCERKAAQTVQPGPRGYRAESGPIHTFERVPELFDYVTLVNNTRALAMGPPFAIVFTGIHT